MHARRDLSACAKQLALKLFDCSNYISTKILLEAEEGNDYALEFNKPYLFSGLHCASLFGIVEIVTDLIEVEGCDINQRDCVDNTPLVWAAIGGHERVVEMLLERGDISPDKPGEDSQTPLWFGAWNGSEGVVKMILERDEVDPDKQDSYYRTPLWIAAWNGHEGVVKLLLERDEVNPGKPDNNGQTPL